MKAIHILRTIASGAILIFGAFYYLREKDPKIVSKCLLVGGFISTSVSLIYLYIISKKRITSSK